MNKWLERINGVKSASPSQSTAPRVQFRTPMERTQYIMNAMRNPVAFVQEQFPDVPENIRNNPDAVLQYLQQTRGEQFIQMLRQVSGMNGG